MSAPDALAVSMLVILMVAFGTLMTILYSLYKNAGKSDEIEELMSDLEAPKKVARKKAAGRQSWERESDWWKDDEKI